MGLAVSSVGLDALEEEVFGEKSIHERSFFCNTGGYFKDAELYHSINYIMKKEEK